MSRQAKRQKISHEAVHDEEIEKDEEEKRLESILFGASYDFGAEEDVEGNEMANLADEDLFIVDDAPAKDGEDDEDEDEDEPEPVKGRRSAWVDPTDTQVSLNSARLRKLRDTPNETHLSSTEYERRLRRQFEQTYPAPAWATKSRSKAAKADGDDEDADDEDSLATLLSTTGGLSKRSKIALDKGTLNISRIRDPMFKEKGEQGKAGSIKSLAWHPSRDVPLLAVGGADRRIRVFNIDGHTSPLALTIHIPSLPLTSPSSLSWHPSGKELLITGSRPFYHIYDVQSGSMRALGGKGGALWGTRFTGSNDASLTSKKRSRGGGGGRSDSESMENVAFSTSGNMLAIAGHGGMIHLVDWKSPGQVVGSLKVEGGSVASQGMWWSGDNQLLALSGSSQLHVFDIAQRRCVRKWKDEGGWKGSARGIAGFASSSGKGLLTIGSNVGLVNVYDSDAFEPSLDAAPKPVKTLEQLTTPITNMRFNHDGNIMAVSSDGKDKLRLYHTPTLTPFTNFPTSSTPLGHLTCLAFSSQSEYLAMGNKVGRVLVYNLAAYSAGT